MKKFGAKGIVFITIGMLLLSSIILSAPIKSDDLDCNPDDPSISPDVNNEYEIIIEKWVKDGDDWVEYAEVSLDEIVHFKGEVTNPNQYDIDFCGVIYDIFPDNLRYINESCTLIGSGPEVVEIVDWETNNVSWHRIPILPPGETITFFYDATAVDCGLEINNIYTFAYVMISGEEKIPVFDSDDAEINVICYEDPEIEIEKMVWNGSAWTDYAEVYLGDVVQFKGMVCNPNEEAVIRFSGYIYDLFPDNLRYINKSLRVYREDERWDEIVDWENNMVNWSTITEIYPGECFTFTFNATAVDCGLGENNLFVVAYTRLGETIYNLTGSDDVTVYVDCPCEEADISVDKLVRLDCQPSFKKTVDAEKGDIVVFKLYVNNTGETPLDIVVIDELPEGLIYADDANPEPYNVNDNIITWKFYGVPSGTSKIITFNAEVERCGKLKNVVDVTGTYENQNVEDEDNATVNVDCPEESCISVEKTVKENCCGEYTDFVTIETGEWVTFRINVTNTGDTVLDITVRDQLPVELTYDNSAYPWEPDLIDGNYTWVFENLNPQETITITFQAIGSIFGTHTNVVNVTGITEEKEVYGEDDAVVDVTCSEEPDLEIEINDGLNVKNFYVDIKNNNETDITDLSVEITIKNTGFLKFIDSTITDFIKIFESKTEKTYESDSIRGFGRIQITATASSEEIDQVSSTARGFVLGKFIFIMTPEV